MKKVPASEYEKYDKFIKAAEQEPLWCKDGRREQMSAEAIAYFEILLEKQKSKFAREWLCEAINALKSQPCEDAVSREAVLDLIRAAGKFSLCALIEDLPSVTPKPTECEDVIDRQALRAQFDHLSEVYEGMSEEEKHEAYIYGQIIWAIDNASTVAPKQKTGHWIKHTDGYHRCSECGSRGSAIKAHYCHHCGAQMEIDKDDELKEKKEIKCCLSSSTPCHHEYGDYCNNCTLNLCNPMNSMADAIEQLRDKEE